MSNPAVSVLAEALAGISAAHQNVDPGAPDLAGSIRQLGENAVTSEMELPSGDRYRITVEWLRDESP